MSDQFYQLFLGDCRDIVPGLNALFKIPSFDAMIADPPYGIGYESHHNTNTTDPEGWGKWRKDANFDPIPGDKEGLDESYNFLLDLAPRMAMCGGNYYTHMLPPSKGWVVWDKLDGLQPSHHSDIEMIWTNADRPAKLFRFLWRGIIRKGAANITNSPKLHPNQKPIELFYFLFRYLGLEKDAIVIDPFAGSGSLGEACLRSGLSYVGVEKLEHYYSIAMDRLSAVYDEINLERRIC